MMSQMVFGAHGENAANGRGITPKITIDLLRCGIAVITTGDHIWDQKEIVPFIDTGAVSHSSVPGDGARFAVGAGIGARYYTSLGPFRLDVAVPVNPRPIDKGFQFYLSFGQAF